MAEKRIRKPQSAWGVQRVQRMVKRLETELLADDKQEDASKKLSVSDRIRIHSLIHRHMTQLASYDRRKEKQAEGKKRAENRAFSTYA
jgi:hypothetical protein